MSINRIQVRETFWQLPCDQPGGGDWPDPVGESRRRAAQLVKGSIDHMLQHLDKPLRVSTLSSMAGFSTSHFLALFKSATGYPPKEFFIRLRMQHACILLMGHAARVKEVAIALGYDDQFYFSRLFKSVMGIAPRDYRQKMIGSGQLPVQTSRQHRQDKSERERALMSEVPA
jgi:AraC-like DNA-binding protein